MGHLSRCELHEFPEIFHVFNTFYVFRQINVFLLRNESGPTSSVYRSKGVGEPPMVIGSAGTLMAIRAAVAAYKYQETGNSKDWVSLNVPATCDKIRMAAEDWTLDMIKEANIKNKDA